MGHQSLPHASPMARSMLPVTLWVTFWMEICSPPSSLEETCAHTLQPNIQFALIFQTKSQTTHRQTYGSKVTLGFTSLRRGLSSCCQIHKTFVCSTALFHCLNPSSICSGGDHSGSWSSKCCPTAEASSSARLFRTCCSYCTTQHCLGSPLFTCPPSSVAMHSTLRKNSKISFLYPLQDFTGRRTYWAVSPSMPILFPGCWSCRANPAVLYKFMYQYCTTFVQQHLASIYTCRQCKLVSKLMEVLDVIMDSTQLLLT